MECKPTDPCYVFQGRMNMMSPSLVQPSPSLASSRSIPQYRQRTTVEALDRADDVLDMLGVARAIPIVRPYVRALELLTYGLIILDPLDRLE